MGFLSENGLKELWSRISNTFARKEHTHSEYANQNAFSNVKVGSSTISADTTTDNLTLVAGDNITITTDETNDEITIAATDTVYTHPTYTARTGVPTANQMPAFGGTFTVSQPVSDATGHVTALNSRTITIPSAVATQLVAGLESASDKLKLDYTNIAFGTCSTAAATAAKTVTLSGNTKWVLQPGAIIFVKFSNTNTASGVTLNVNGTGAKNIWYDRTNQTSTTTTSTNYYGYANRILGYVYDGTYYVLFYFGYDANTTYSNASLGQGYGTCATAAATVAKVVTLSNYALVVGGIVAVKFTYAVPASATMNINSKGAKAIYYRGTAITAGVIKAGDIATFIYNGSQYHLLTVDKSIDLDNLVISSILSSSGWSGDSAPYTNTVTISNTDVDKYEVGYIEMDNTATTAQQMALTDANIGSEMDYDEGTRVITFYAYGEKPSIDIPIQLTFTASMDIVESIDFVESGSTGNDIVFGAEPSNPNDNQIWCETSE